ncbi:hypothetical protein [Brumimicrobium aurantiacum]|uniref:Outer membrane protein beta-barrel domain-containing protein n=1 Tax=Brumimicrobium aurantiacum TaxID=1737063 RepID=A0A3E1F014_9FLAO|nr:hypothetical protein [Brumimicrobium aurantiacum]RFC55145.1 hypothetical protein DXU93_04810 [Brumimicrobium aurantiacum]
MKNKSVLSVIGICVLVGTLWSQEPEKKVKPLKISDVFISNSFIGFKSEISTLDHFKSLAPESVFLQNDFSEFTNHKYSYGNINSMFAVNLGIQFANKEGTKFRNNPLLRIGIGYSQNSILSSSYSNETRTPYDTLISSQTGNTHYIDSVNTERYSMSYGTDIIHLDASLILRTDPEARWSMYGGIGFNFGISIDSYTSISKFNDEKTEIRNASQQFNGSFGIDNYNYESEHYKNETTYSLAAYIPLGIDFRIGKNRPFWQRTHLFYEFRPYMTNFFIPELSTISKVGFQNSFGLRVNLN